MRMPPGWQRLLVAGAAALVAVPWVVSGLTVRGVAGSWFWLPACVALVSVTAGGAALALWEDHPWRRPMAAASFAWAAFILALVYLPGSVTPASLERAVEQIDYPSDADPEVDEDYCLPWESRWSCPSLRKVFTVKGKAEATEVLTAIEDAGFELETPAVRSSTWRDGGHAWRLEYQGRGLWMEVTVAVGGLYKTAIGDTNFSFVSAAEDTVTVRLYDRR